MSDIVVKFKDNMDPSKMPRVYFSCHPDDFDTYFNLLSDELEGVANCVIYFEDERESQIDNEDLQFFFVSGLPDGCSGDKKIP